MHLIDIVYQMIPRVVTFKFRGFYEKSNKLTKTEAKGLPLMPEEQEHCETWRKKHIAQHKAWQHRTKASKPLKVKKPAQSRLWKRARRGCRLRSKNRCFTIVIGNGDGCTINSVKRGRFSLAAHLSELMSCIHIFARPCVAYGGILI